MSLDAWGDEGWIGNPLVECRICDGSGEVQEVIDSLLVCHECPHCQGLGERESEDPDDPY